MKQISKSLLSLSVLFFSLSALFLLSKGLTQIAHATPHSCHFYTANGDWQLDVNGNMYALIIESDSIDARATLAKMAHDLAVSGVCKF